MVLYRLLNTRYFYQLSKLLLELKRASWMSYERNEQQAKRTTEKRRQTATNNRAVVSLVLRNFPGCSFVHLLTVVPLERHACIPQSSIRLPLLHYSAHLRVATGAKKSKIQTCICVLEPSNTSPSQVGYLRLTLPYIWVQHPILQCRLRCFWMALKKLQPLAKKIIIDIWKWNRHFAFSRVTSKRKMKSRAQKKGTI